MKTIRYGLLTIMVAVAGLIGGSAPSSSSAFHAWQVFDVPQWDTLNVRAYPSPKSQILVAYPNGTVLSMTGICTDGLDLAQISGYPAWKQRQYVRYAWCQTWIDPQGMGQFRTAWVYGKFIRPM